MNPSMHSLYCFKKYANITYNNDIKFYSILSTIQHQIRSFHVFSSFCFPPTWLKLYLQFNYLVLTCLRIRVNIQLSIKLVPCHNLFDDDRRSPLSCLYAHLSGLFPGKLSFSSRPNASESVCFKFMTRRVAVFHDKLVCVPFVTNGIIRAFMISNPCQSSFAFLGFSISVRHLRIRSVVER
jgi:hypothetical protein